MPLHFLLCFGHRLHERRQIAGVDTTLIHPVFADFDVDDVECFQSCCKIHQRLVLAIIFTLEQTVPEAEQEVKRLQKAGYVQF